MATDVSVVIAYRDMGDEHRRASFEYVRAWYEQHPAGFEVIVEAGESDESFTRASAINTAVERAAGRVIVQSDPDSLIPDPGRLADAVDLAALDGLVIPHDRYLYLTPAATRDVYAGRSPDTVGPDDCETSGIAGSGNVVAFSRATWETAGRYDQRFGLWGGDDAAFRYACEALVGPTRRLAGDMVHLWHPRLPQSEPGGPGYADQFAILAQYRDAAEAGPDAVRALVASR